MFNHTQAQMICEIAHMLLPHGATARISRAEMTPGGLATRFEGGHSAVIALCDLRVPGSPAPVELITYSPAMAAFRTAGGDPLQLGAGILYGLAQPGGREALEDHWRSNEFVADRSVRRLRHAINMPIATLAKTTRLTDAKLVAVEAGAYVSLWDLLLIGAALDAHLPDILLLQLALSGALKDRRRPDRGPKVAG